MKVIQGRELDRICQMIKSGDQEMRDLAAKILKNKEKIRLTYSTIILFHSIFFLASLTGMIYLYYRFTLGLYLIPLIAAVLIQTVFSTIELVTIASQRKKYNTQIKELSEK